MFQEKNLSKEVWKAIMWNGQKNALELKTSFDPSWRYSNIASRCNLSKQELQTVFIFEKVT
jgi:hypothetical protein